MNAHLFVCGTLLAVVRHPMGERLRRDDALDERAQEGGGGDDGRLRRGGKPH